jgi:hypothetical protein
MVDRIDLGIEVRSSVDHRCCDSVGIGFGVGVGVEVEAEVGIDIDCDKGWAGLDDFEDLAQWYWYWNWDRGWLLVLGLL